MALSPADFETSSATHVQPKPSGGGPQHVVPESPELREQICARAAAAVRDADRARPLGRAALTEMSENVLVSLGLGGRYLGFVRLALSNEFWRDQFLSVGFERRLLVLPQRLEHSVGCGRPELNGTGADGVACGACAVAALQATAEELGYNVLAIESRPAILKIIVSGQVEAILAVAPLGVLERALHQLLTVGVPTLALPLVVHDATAVSIDTGWLRHVLGARQARPAPVTRSYLTLLKAANRLFEPAHLEYLVPRVRRATAEDRPNGDRQSECGAPAGFAVGDPLRSTEEIAYDWLAHGGKRLRPFITLAVYDALKHGTQIAGSDGDGLGLPDSIRRAAVAIETFHKASLVHDDIEDDDTYRYGRETLHRRHGLPVAINVGDYLIGLGYRLVSREAAALGGDCVADILNRFADAHVKLSEGQGAELAWRDAACKELKPADALKIYALKTAPAFEAALYAGLRLAGPVGRYGEMVTTFSRHLGLAFQVLNDLKDWEEDATNKLEAGRDVLAGRPTVLLALALESAAAADREELLSLLGQMPQGRATVDRVREIFEAAGVFERAEKLVKKHRRRAEAMADAAEPAELRELLAFLIETVLDRQPPPGPEDAVASLAVTSGT